MLFISHKKLLLFSKYLSCKIFKTLRYFCLDFLIIYRNGLIKKKVNFKLYDVAAWFTNYFNTHIAQYFEK